MVFTRNYTNYSYIHSRKFDFRLFFLKSLTDSNSKKGVNTMFGKIMHVNGTSLYKTYDTPKKSSLIAKKDNVDIVVKSHDDHQTVEDISLVRIFAKLNRGEELIEAELNYVRMHDLQLYQEISLLYSLRGDVLKALEELSFEEAMLFVRKEKEELSKSLQKAYKGEATSSSVRVLEWYYSLLDKVWYNYLKKREGKAKAMLNGKIA